jgi:DNA processing protein
VVITVNSEPGTRNSEPETRNPEHPNRLAWIALAWVAQLGATGFHRLIARFGSPEAAAEAGEDALRASGARLTEDRIPRIMAAMDDLPAVETELERLAEAGARVLCPFDAGYPPVLAEMHHPPPVICVSGDWRAEDLLAVGVVGTRSPSREGADLAEQLGAALAAARVTVVSGLARGIDTAAHRGALAGGGRTIAVLGSGIRIIHPAENAPLAAQIAARGAVISELSPNARPSVRTLMARNRLQSALSKAVVVVESGEQGGSLQTAEDARRQGRLLFAVDWARPSPTSAGTRKLIAEGARPLRGLEDVPGLVEMARAHVPVSARRREGGGGKQLDLF